MSCLFTPTSQFVAISPAIKSTRSPWAALLPSAVRSPTKPPMAIMKPVPGWRRRGDLSRDPRSAACRGSGDARWMLASNPGREFRLDSVIDRFLASSADRALGRRERPEMRCALRISSPDWTVIASRARTAISSQDGDLAHRLADCKEIPLRYRGTTPHARRCRRPTRNSHPLLRCR
jgi:hypothetical protein